MLFLSGTTKTWYGGTDVTGGLNRKLCRRTSVPTFSEVLYMQISHNHNYLLINCYVTKYTKALFAGAEQQHKHFQLCFRPAKKLHTVYMSIRAPNVKTVSRLQPRIKMTKNSTSKYRHGPVLRRWASVLSTPDTGPFLPGGTVSLQARLAARQFYPSSDIVT